MRLMDFLGRYFLIITCVLLTISLVGLLYVVIAQSNAKLVAEHNATVTVYDVSVHTRMVKSGKVNIPRNTYSTTLLCQLEDIETPQVIYLSGNNIYNLAKENIGYQFEAVVGEYKGKCFSTEFVDYRINRDVVYEVLINKNSE